MLEKLATIQMVDVWIPMVDGRWLILPRYTQPETDTKMLLHKLQIDLACSTASAHHDQSSASPPAAFADSITPALVLW